MKANIKVLGVDLLDEQKLLFNQFENVKAFDADLTNQRSPASRKAEAILLAADDGVEAISLLDGDCIVTGDISPYLTKGITGISARVKSNDEDGINFSRNNRYSEEDSIGNIPKSILQIWEKDVGERSESRISNTVCGGNLSINISHLDFINCWHRQMMKVLPNKFIKEAYDYSDFAYFQMDESVLNSLLAFKETIPELSPGWFDKDPKALVAHLGPCNPRYWYFWRYDKLKHYKSVIGLLEWAKDKYEMPKLTWALTKRNKPLIYVCAYIYEIKNILKKILLTIKN